jgi:hypothetical protein
MLSLFEQEKILNEFPNIKLSYENIAYKKVYNSDVILAIPEGKKCFAWFTINNNNNVCLIMETTSNKQIKNTRITNVCFSSELSYGTILYGTVFYYKNNNFFAIEDIFCYKGKNIERENWGNKFQILNKMLEKDLKQVSYNNSFIVFGLPLISNNIDELANKMKDVYYKIDCLHFRLYNRINNYLIMTFKSYIENYVENKLDKNNQKSVVNNRQIPIKNEKNETKNILKREIVFKIRPDIQDDIYHLYCLNDNLVEEYYNVAHIPDYNTSVFMNKLFRNIKENNNLDTLEESDDEDEFENEKEDKFVYLDREYNIVCSYNYKFKKWVPMKLIDNKHNISKKTEIESQIFHKSYEPKNKLK